VQAVVPAKVPVIAQVKVQDVAGVAQAARANVQVEADQEVLVAAEVQEFLVVQAVQEDPGLPAAVAGLAVIFDLEHKKDFGMMAICKNYD
jgi:hypothetical protein